MISHTTFFPSSIHWNHRPQRKNNYSSNYRSPVCGSNGQSYGNECQMRQAACMLRQTITAVSMENCGGKREVQRERKSVCVWVGAGEGSYVRVCVCEQTRKFVW